MADKARRTVLISAGVAAALTVAASVAVADQGQGGAPSAAPAVGTGQPASDRSASDPAAAAAAHAAPAVSSTTATGVARLPAGAHVEGRLPNAAPLHLSVNLKPRDAQALQSFVESVSTPGSRHYHHFLTKGQFRRDFGPTGRTLAHVTAVLRAAGLQPGAPTADGLSIPVTVTAAQATKVFGASVDSVKLADGTQGYLNTKPAVLPGDLAAVVSGVTGLTDTNRMRPHHASSGRTATPHGAVGTTTPARSHVTSAGSAPALCAAMGNSLGQQFGVSDGHGYYSPASIASAYGLGSLTTAGTAPTVAVFELESVDLSAVADYQSCLGTTAKVSVTSVGRTSGNAPADDTAVGVESALDIEDLAGLLPAGSQIIDYEGQDANNSAGDNELDVFRQIVNDDLASVISTSWGICEGYQDSATLAAENTIFAKAAAQGESVVAAAGDSGSSDCYNTNSQTGPTGLGVDDPASQPYVTGVGGTWMRGQGSGLSQGVWNNTTNGQGADAGGGGVSRKWGSPAYQGGFSGSGFRTVPDVSALADPMTGYPILLKPGGTDQYQIEGGTSASAPTWAALLARADASQTCQAGQPGQHQVGFANPALYDVARSGYGSGYYDITSGSNNLSGLQASSSYAAHGGYDLASGLGTPKLAGLAARLCAPAGQAATGPGSYHPLATPARFLDTYWGTGWGVNGAQRAMIPAYGTAPVKVTGHGGVPATGVTAVTVNVTITPVGGGSGELAATPDGSARNGTYPVFWTAANSHRTQVITVPVPADGVVDFYTTGMIHLDVDVEGYWSHDTSGLTYTSATTPAHVLDTYRRIGVSTAGQVTNRALTFKVTGGAPAGVQAVALNLTAFDSTGTGFLRATSGGSGLPNTLDVAWNSGSGVVDNLVYVPVDPATGTVTVYVTGTTEVFGDVEGWFTAAGSHTFQPLTAGQAPRVLNTVSGIGAARGRVTVGHPVTFQVTGGGRAVPSGASYVLLDITALDTISNGGLAAYGQSSPAFPNCYWSTATVGCAVLVPLSSTGTATVRVTSTADLVADVQGWIN